MTFQDESPLVDGLRLVTIDYMLLVVVDALVGQIHGPSQSEMIRENALFVNQIFSDNMDAVGMLNPQAFHPS